eukprot:6126475-Pleurochrysis_carterae.AAC.3
MKLALEKKYAGHPILRLFTRPVEMENGIYTRMPKGDIAHMNAASVAATDGAKKGGFKDRGPESVEILGNKLREAPALQKRLGVTLDQMDKARAVEKGVLNGKLGDSATAAGAELFAIFAILRKVQAKQYMGQYGKEKARILIMSDCLSGLRILEQVW